MIGTDLKGVWARPRQVELALMTRTRACAVGYGSVVHDEAKFFAVMIPDSGEMYFCNFRALQNVATWVRAMQPRSIAWGVAPGEDKDQLAAALKELAGASVH